MKMLQASGSGLLYPLFPSDTTPSGILEGPCRFLSTTECSLQFIFRTALRISNPAPSIRLSLFELRNTPNEKRLTNSGKNWIPYTVVFRNLQGPSRMTVALLFREG